MVAAPFTTAKERAKHWIDEYHNAARYRKALRTIAYHDRPLTSLSYAELLSVAQAYRLIAQKAVEDRHV